MLLIIALLLAGPAVTSPDGVSFQWVSKPKHERLAHCARQLTANGVDARVTVECTSAAKDRVENCKVIESSAPDNPEVEATALCWAKGFRIRTTDEAGQVVTGATVQIPYSMASLGGPRRPGLETSTRTWTTR